MVDTQVKLQEIFRSVFDLAPDRDASGVDRSNQPNWDSLAHVTLVAAIESEFGVELDTVDALELTSFQAAEKVLARRGA